MTVGTIQLYSLQFIGILTKLNMDVYGMLIRLPILSEILYAYVRGWGDSILDGNISIRYN